LRIYSIENDSVRNASVIENATSRLNADLCIQVRCVKNPESPGLPQVLALFSLRFTLRSHKWRLPIEAFADGVLMIDHLVSVRDLRGFFRILAVWP
jgi:hypothetical protein